MEYILYNQHFERDGQTANSSKPELIVYEVLRVIESIPLFYEDHLERLYHSCEIVGRKVDFDAVVFFDQLIELSLKNNITHGNLMISVLFFPDNHQVKAQFIPHVYPREQAYVSGVEVGFLDAERPTPNAKVAQTSVRVEADKVLAQTGFYEVLLVDQNHCITEGSRSNCLGIRENKMFTAPFDKILKGITLLKVIDIARELNIEVVYEPINRYKLASFDALFLTGTSPRILPVNRAGEFHFDVNHPLMNDIREVYDRMISDYIAQKKETILKSPL